MSKGLNLELNSSIISTESQVAFWQKTLWSISRSSKRQKKTRNQKRSRLRSNNLVERTKIMSSLMTITKMTLFSQNLTSLTSSWNLGPLKVLMLGKIRHQLFIMSQSALTSLRSMPAEKSKLIRSALPPSTGRAHWRKSMNASGKDLDSDSRKNKLFERV